MVDDADGYVYERFYPSDTTWANMWVVYGHLCRQSKSFHHHKKWRNQLEVVYANSPQAKGRLDWLFGFFKDRLIKEMRLKGIKNYNEANRFLEEEFLPCYNSRYTLSVESIYRELTKDKDLELKTSKKG